MNNKQVAKNWSIGRKGKSSNGNYHTDGSNLYSYNMLIGRTLPNGDKQVLNVRGKDSYSQTTSKHVGLAHSSVRAGDSVAPIITRSVFSSWREFPQTFQALSLEEWQAANLKAYENNTQGLAVYGSNDEDFQRVAIDKLLPRDIAYIAYETYTGDYAPLYVNFVGSTPNASQWYLVRSRI